ncbi:MAG: GNAT family N-acetyltransferase [Firmicutes bacterium]|nr:GNAT family N-acetyltransferase [Bacillota bacterium]
MVKLFETDRLIVRNFEAGDAKDLFEYVSDAEVTKFLTFPTYKNIKQAHERIQFLHDKIYTKKEIGKDHDFAVAEKNSKKIIGSIGFSRWEKYGKDTSIAELGYIINPKYCGKGYASEMVRGMLEYIGKNKLIKRVEAKHDPDNPASGKVMLKAGMKYCRTDFGTMTNNINENTDAVVYYWCKRKFSSKKPKS